MIYTTAVPSFSLTNAKFESITLHEAQSVVKTGTLQELSLINITFDKIHSVAKDQTTNYIFEFGSLDVGHTTKFEINSLIVNDINMPILNFNRISNYETSASMLEINNVEVTNSYITAKVSLIAFTNIVANTNFTMSMTNITFNGVEFATKGDLLLFEHQITHTLILTNLIISNTRRGSIQVVASSPNNSTLPCSVSISNMTTSNVFGGYNSLIYVLKNTYLNISNSLLTGIYNFEAGAVLTSSYQNSLVNIHNTTIEFNAAIEGGVFRVISGGTIKVYDSWISENFAMNAAVVKADDGGHYEFHN